MAAKAKNKQFQNYINGEWVDACSEATFENRNPATGELLGEFARSDGRDVNAAVAAAKAAYRTWSLFPAPRRAEIDGDVGGVRVVLDVVGEGDGVQPVAPRLRDVDRGPDLAVRKHRVEVEVALERLQARQVGDG